jgi:hypothetical protein
MLIAFSLCGASDRAIVFLCAMPDAGRVSRHTVNVTQTDLDNNNIVFIDLMLKRH